ncbi:PQ loop repeat-domain-containing protein [Fomitopsis serialis]|uniref:PQ loop repeat-domain-containing protein n=1 Tax=Fomitopsis serialis TaxID=139415 RepID=UPI0020072037|nr:PQ loop repeat-domain-containing protein [Neoantrodia serialis]KAH9933337.1 PQ loop repeat-domain-containing protein [Neoantrodia serialis]
MPANKAAENALGTIGTICWTIQLVPQLWKSHREKSTEGLSQFLVFIWGASGVLLGVYAIVQNINIPIIVQPQLFGTLSFLSFAQCQYYGSKRPFWTCVAIYIVCLALLGGLQVGFVYAVRPSYEHGHSAGVEFFGIASSVTIAAGLLPQYYEIWKHGEVIGISIPFMTVDMLGGVFNDLSLAFKSDFNVIASVTYSLVVVMDGIVILLALILNPLARRRRKRAAMAAMEVDTAPADPSGGVGRIGDVELAGAENRQPTPSSNARDVNEKPEAAAVDEERGDMTVTTSNARRDTPQHSHRTLDSNDI